MKEFTLNVFINAFFFPIEKGDSEQTIQVFKLARQENWLTGLDNFKLRWLPILQSYVTYFKNKKAFI